MNSKNATAAAGVLAAVLCTCLSTDGSPAPEAEAVPHRLQNLSARARVQSGEDVIIAGFIIRGEAPKQLLVRAVGPSLNINGAPLPGRLADPTLELWAQGGSTPIATNDNWRDSQQANAIAASGLAPSADPESAVLATLPVGNYTAVVRGRDNQSGLGLVEVFDVDGALGGKLANISARARVDSGDNVLIAGLIAGGSGADASIRTVIRAMGPSLGAAGVNNPLADPSIELRDANGALIGFCNDWADCTPLDLQGTGLAPDDGREAAIVVVLSAGRYTAIARSNSGTPGVGLVEVYDVPQTPPGG